MATADTTPQAAGRAPVRYPLDSRAIGPVLARQQRPSPFRMTVETDRHGDTSAWLEPRATVAEMATALQAMLEMHSSGVVSLGTVRFARDVLARAVRS